MSQVYITDRNGTDLSIDIRPGASLMQAITDAGISDLLALCGGVCSCATCHVYIEGEPPEELSPLSDDENDLLDFSSHRQENSRLSCQIRLNHALDGLKATIAPED